MTSSSIPVSSSHLLTHSSWPSANVAWKVPSTIIVIFSGFSTSSATSATSPAVFPACASVSVFPVSFPVFSAELPHPVNIMEHTVTATSVTDNNFFFTINNLRPYSVIFSVVSCCVSFLFDLLIIVTSAPEVSMCLYYICHFAQFKVAYFKFCVHFFRYSGFIFYVNSTHFTLPHPISLPFLLIMVL